MSPFYAKFLFVSLNTMPQISTDHFSVLTGALQHPFPFRSPPA